MVKVFLRKRGDEIMGNYKKIFCILSVILISIAISGATKGNGNENQTEIKEKTAAAEQLISYAGIEEYRVQSFDTLSSIAVKYIPSDKCMSKWISDVKRLNNRKSNDIYFNEVIRVYVYEK